MRVASVNAGSSSLKLSVVEPDDRVEARCDIERWDGAGTPEQVRLFLAEAGAVDAVAHRVVHGGDRFAGPAVIDAATIADIAALTELAPLHQPRALAAIDVVRAALPATPAVACFDTAFHQSMPDAAASYALPAEWRQRWPIRRYGFHGLSHAWASRRAAAIVDRPAESVRAVTCHLGAGASLCAVDGGRSVDTTMGFTPLDGLVMQTRSGSIDPGLVLWLVGRGLSADDVLDGLEHRSGLAGLAGSSGDMRAVLAARRGGDAAAAAAFDVYVHRLCASIAAMSAALGGLDLLAFTGGVGEHAPEVRSAVADRLGYLGVRVDDDANAAAHGDADVSAAAADARTVVVTAREDVEMARQARAVLAA